MYNYGLECFIQAKKLKSKECINAFLRHEGITEFTAVHHNRVNQYIQNHWNRFSTFVDKGIKSGELTGRAIKLNTHFDEERQRREICKAEYENLTPEAKHLYNFLRKQCGDLVTGLSMCYSFMTKQGESYWPKNNYETVSLAGRNEPKLNYLAAHPLRDQLIEHLKSKTNGQ